MRLQALLVYSACQLGLILIPVNAIAQTGQLLRTSDIHAQIEQYVQERQQIGMPVEPIADISSFWGVWQTEGGTEIGFYPARSAYLSNVSISRVCLLSDRYSDEIPSGFSEALDFQTISDLELFSYEDPVDLTLPALRARLQSLNLDLNIALDEPLPQDQFEGFSSYVQNFFEGHYFVRLGDELIWFKTEREVPRHDGDYDEQSGEREIKEIKRTVDGEPVVLSFVGELPPPEAFLSEGFTQPERFFYPENTPAPMRQDSYVLQMFHAAGCRLSMDEPLPYPFPAEMDDLTLQFEDASQTDGGVTISVIGGDRTDPFGYRVPPESSSFRFHTYVLIENQSDRPFYFETSRVGLEVEGVDLRDCTNSYLDFPGCSNFNRFEIYTGQSIVQPGGSIVGRLIRDQRTLSISEFLAPQVSILIDEKEEFCSGNNSCRHFSIPLRLAE